MAGSASPLASLFTPQTFTGVSQYSSDFQSILTRAVQIQQLPLTAAQQADTVVLSKKSALSSLSATVGAFADSLRNLGTVSAGQALSAASSAPSVLTAAATGAKDALTYTIDSVTSLAAAASETSVNGYAAAGQVSPTGVLKLVAGSQTYGLNLASGANTLQGLVNAINSSGAPVTASVLTTGSGAASNYLSITANAPGQTTLQLFDDPAGANTNLLTAKNQGSNAVFSLNGIPVTQAGNTVNAVIPGVTINLLGTSATPTTVTLSSDRGQVTSALSDFAAKYNALADAATAQTGPSAGPLSGDSVVREIQAALRQVASYGTPGANIQSLSDLGLTFDSAGKLTLDPGVLANLSGAQLGDAFRFLGSAAFGLAGLASRFSQISDPLSGVIQAEQQTYSQADTRYQDQIVQINQRVAAFQAAEQQKLQRADAAVAGLASTQNALSASLTGLNYVLYGKNLTTL